MKRWQSRSLWLWAVLLVSSSLLSSKQASAQTTVFRTVDSHAGPWLYVPGGLNDAYQYGINDHIGPMVVSGADGFDFTAGGSFTITYLSGLTNAFGAAPDADAMGHTWYLVNDLPGSSGMYEPSYYFNHADYPAYLMALVGTFADAAGAIVGVPFQVALGRTVAVPVGATQLQLGLNDDIFADNTGALNVRITGPSAASVVPEGNSLVLLAVGSLGLLVGIRRRIRN